MVPTSSINFHMGFAGIVNGLAFLCALVPWRYQPMRSVAEQFQQRPPSSMSLRDRAPRRACRNVIWTSPNATAFWQKNGGG